jgi:hypothetical protein
MEEDYFNKLLTSGALEVIPLKFSKAGVKKVIEDIKHYPEKIDSEYGKLANPIKHVIIPDDGLFDEYKIGRFGGGFHVVLKKKTNIILDSLFGNFDYWDDEDGVCYGEGYRDSIGFAVWYFPNDKRYCYFERDGRKLCEGAHFHDSTLGLDTHRNCGFPNHIKRMCNDLVSIFKKHSIR